MEINLNQMDKDGDKSYDSDNNKEQSFLNE